MSASIFVVDDDPDVRESLADLLVDEGYTVAVAADGEEALARLRSGLHVDLVLLDVRMPKKSGLQVLVALQASPQMAQVPVLLMSAEFDGAIAPGALAWMAKPFEPAALLAMISKHLAQAEQRRTA